MTAETISGDVTMGGASATVLANRYRVVRPLGQGGMGSVWLAEDTKLDGRLVAVKMLPSVLVSNKRAYNQLKAEALVSLKLTHPNIAAVRAFEENDGNPFLVIDYIDGLTLDEYLAKKGRLDEETTFCILEPIARALDYAHSKGVVHRDVKPGNVMVTWDGDPYILDFGIAREIQETMTRVTGKLSSGTLLYMSPEQLHGAAPKPAQDVYSFSALAYECLTGHPPFSRGQVEWQILNDTPEPLPENIVMGRRVMAGLSKKPEDRPRHCSSILKGWRLAEGNGGEKPEEGPPAKAEPETETQAEAPAVAPERNEPLRPSAADTQSSRSLSDRWKLLAIVGLVLAVVVTILSSREKSMAKESVPVEPAEMGTSVPVPTVKPREIDDQYVEVGVLVGRVERLDRTGGFADDIDVALDLQGKARANYELQKWDEAKRLFGEAKKAAEALIERDRLRTGAKVAAQRAEKAAARAEAAKAEQLAAKTWAHALGERDRAEGEFRTGRFRASADRYASAESLFADAEKAAINEAVRLKIPTLRLIAKVDGREVTGAKVRMGGREYETPVSFGKVRKNDQFGPFELSYSENYRLYEGRFEAFSVTWEGAKTYVFELKEHKFPAAGTRKVVTLDSQTEMAFRWCPAGEFMMGSPENESGRWDDENRHLVKLMRGYWMGETEVTQGQWMSLMDGADVLLQARRALNDDTVYMLDGKRQTLREYWKQDRFADPSSRCGNVDTATPVYYVSWIEAVEFCRRLTARERIAGRLPSDYEYRLPTEEEWERACRAGTTTPLPNGRDIAILGANNAPALDEIAWYGGNSSVGFSGVGWLTDNWPEKQYLGGRAAPRRVRTKKANNWGLYDMIGNVEEWCGDYYLAQAGSGLDPTRAGTLQNRVLRGGAWQLNARVCRSSFRDFASQTLRRNYIGFRVALAPVYVGYPYGVPEYKSALR